MGTALGTRPTTAGPTRTGQCQKTGRPAYSDLGSSRPVRVGRWCSNRTELGVSGGGEPAGRGLGVAPPGDTTSEAGSRRWRADLARERMENWRAHYNTKVQVKELEDLVRKLPKRGTTASEPTHSRHRPPAGRRADGGPRRDLPSGQHRLRSRQAVRNRPPDGRQDPRPQRHKDQVRPDQRGHRPSRTALREGRSLARIGRQLGVSETTVHRRRRERTGTIRRRYGAAR